jgi:hypothetical protein
MGKRSAAQRMYVLSLTDVLELAPAGRGAEKAKTTPHERIKSRGVYFSLLRNYAWVSFLRGD